MFIKQITIEATDGVDVEMAHTDDGVLVTQGERIICEMRRDETDDRTARVRRGPRRSVAAAAPVSSPPTLGSLG